MSGSKVGNTAGGSNDLAFMSIPSTTSGHEENPFEMGEKKQVGSSANGQNGSSGGPPGEMFGFVKNSQHPTAAFFHIFFKVVALLMYIFGTLFIGNFVFVMVVVILLLAFDFWTVKNVTGRLLVGLRWWNLIKEDGSSEWVFESLENDSVINPSDKKVFWYALYATPVFWGVLLIVSILKFNLQWMVIVFIAISLSVANIVGYTKCSNDAKKKIKEVQDNAVNAAIGGALGSASNIMNNFLLSTFGGQNNNGRSPQGYVSQQDNSRNDYASV